jgi:hypothetical protein
VTAALPLRNAGLVPIRMSPSPAPSRDGSGFSLSPNASICRSDTGVAMVDTNPSRARLQAAARKRSGPISRCSNGFTNIPFGPRAERLRVRCELTLLRRKWRRCTPIAGSGLPPTATPALNFCSLARPSRLTAACSGTNCSKRGASNPRIQIGSRGILQSEQIML